MVNLERSKATEKLERFLAQLVHEPPGAIVDYPSTAGEIDPEILEPQVRWLVGHPRVRRYQHKLVGMDTVQVRLFLK